MPWFAPDTGAGDGALRRQHLLRRGLAPERHGARAGRRQRDQAARTRAPPTWHAQRPPPAYPLAPRSSRRPALLRTAVLHGNDPRDLGTAVAAVQSRGADRSLVLAAAVP